MTRQVSILSIDAWRNDGGWEWNNWFKVGTFDLESQAALLDSPRKLFAWLRSNGYLSDGSKGNVVIDDDQYNVVICDRRNHQPVFAIAYGEAEN